MYKTTYIKDLKKAEHVVGDERVLIQDDESTKQVSLGVIVNSVIEQSTVGINEAIDNFNTAGEEQIEAFNNTSSQQINTFINEAQTRLDGVLYEADTINLRINDAKKDILTQANRIDSIIALPEGSTTSDAELLDIRIGADGYKYGSAGESVRAQTSQKIGINQLREELVNSFIKEVDKYELELNDGYYNSDLDFTASSEYKNTIINVNPGEEYRIVLKKVWTHPGYFLMYDDQKIDNEKSETSYGLVDCFIEIPLHCNKLIIQFSELLYFGKVTKYLSAVTNRNQIEDDLIDIDKLDKNIKRCFNCDFLQIDNIEWVSGYYMNNQGILFKNDAFRYSEISVKKNEKIKINSKRNWDASAYIFKDKYGLVIGHDNSTVGTQELVVEEIIVPDDGAIIINDYNNNSFKSLQIKRKVSINIDDNSISFNNLDSSLKDMYEISFQKIDLNWTYGFVLKSDGSLQKTDEGYGYAVVDVEPGMIFRITGARGWQSSCYIIKDSNGLVILSDGRDETKETIITNEEIIIPSNGKQLFIGSYRFKDIRVKNKLVMKNNMSRLRDKTILYNGDSICEGIVNNGGYSKIIEEDTGCFTENRAVGGATLAVKRGESDRHRICKDVVNMSNKADLVCFEGGINDYWGSIPLGQLTSLDDFISDVNEETVIGALESIFRQSLKKWPGTPIMFVIVHPIQNTRYINNSAGYTFEKMANSIKDVCRKYSIPYIDLLNESGGFNCNINDIAQRFTVNGDGCHPNVDGYKKYYVNPIRSKIEELI